MEKSIGAADVTLTPGKGLTGVYALCYVASLTEYTVIKKRNKRYFQSLRNYRNPLSILLEN